MSFDQQREWQHLKRMISTPGWSDQAKHRAMQLERSTLWVGASAAVESEMLARKSESERQTNGG